jgi:two-component system response regulator NreC
LVVVAAGGDAESALRSVLSHEPGVVVLDLNMPGELTALQAIPRVCERSPRTAVVILTMQDDPSFARHALDVGARGYVLKDAANAELVNAVRRAADGDTYLPQSLGALAGGPREQ